MSILINKKSRIVVQGITGRYGRQQVSLMLNFGTNIVAGVSPGKGSEEVQNIPVYDTVKEAVEEHSVDTSIIYVPPFGVREAVIEAIDQGVKTVMIATEHVPTLDAMFICEYAIRKNSWIIGPNTAGLINPEEVLLGSVAPDFTKKGPVGVITRSGSLINEVSRMLTNQNIGQSTSVDIGGDMIIGRNIKDYLRLYEKDSDTEAIILLGEIGGKLEYEAGDYIKSMLKPVFTYIAGANVPEGKKMGHVGALVSEESESALEKEKYLKDCGAIVVETIWQLPKAIRQYHKKL